MKGAFRPLRLWCMAMALAVASAGCRRAQEEPDAPVTEELSSTPAEGTPEPLPAGRHTLTASPPVTPADLDRLLGLGFTPDEVLAEIERRGVLKRPDGSERTHIQLLPRGERMLDAMDSPGNLLSKEALARYGQRQAGGSNLEQWRLSQASMENNYHYAAQAQAQSYAARNRQTVEYQHRRDDLAQRIASLKRKRTEMQRRGEMIAIITIEIDRLERESAALTPPK